MATLSDTVHYSPPGHPPLCGAPTHSYEYSSLLSQVTCKACRASSHLTDPPPAKDGEFFDCAEWAPAFPKQDL